MKSKFYLTLFFIGILPVLALSGVHFWMVFNQTPAPQGPAANNAAVQASLPALKSQLDTMASTMSANIQKVHGEIPNLFTHHTDTDLDNFVRSHPGVSGLVVFSPAGKVERTIPAAPPLISDPSYGASEEFQKTVEKLKENGGKPYLFYTQKLGPPAFIFAVPLSSSSIALAVLNLSNFFRNMDTNSGDISLLETGTGTFFYHTNPAKVGAAFNPNQEAWLAKIQAELGQKQGGMVHNPELTSAVYAHVFASFGMVHTFPSSILQPTAPPPAAVKPSLENLPELLHTPMSLAFLVCLGWIFIVGSICLGMILAPLRKASAAVLNAAQGRGALTAETARRFGRDDVGQMVQAASVLMEKLESDKRQAAQEKEEALRKGKAEVEAKTRDAAEQVSAAQKQAQAARTELNDKNQMLNDKLKELDALKSMSEGLRNQTEQSKTETARLKSQISAAEQAQGDLKKNVQDTLVQLKEMESKMLQVVATSSAIQVSQVRAAAIRTMAEELKTTLGIIKGYVSSALGATQSGISEKQQEFLGMVINRSARLEKFINDLLDIYQVEIEQAEAKHEDVNLAAEIEGLAFNFQAQAEVKNIKIKVEGKPDVPKVPIVRRRFNQLWNILYLQIIKDAPRASNILITVEAIGENVKVMLQDPGLTVVPESLPKLFDEFYDPKHPASPQLAGTGLKFALVKTILAAHGGGAVAEKADPGTKLLLTFSTKVKRPGPPAMPAFATPAPPLTPKSLGVTPVPGVAAVPKPPAPTMGMPGMAKPAAPSLGVPKPPGAPGLLDSLTSKPAAPGLKPPTAPGLTPPGMPAAPKPPMPGMPAPPPMGAPKPAAPGGGFLDALIDKKPAPPTSGAPAIGAGLPQAPMGMPKPPIPGMPAPSAPGPAIPPMGAPKPPVPAAAAPSPGMPPAPKPPTPGVPAGAAPPPVPGIPAAPRPPMPPPGMPPGPGAPPVPAPPKVIPTAMKPAPAPGVLDLDSMDSFKVDAGPPKPPASPAPPMGAPKPVVPSPGVPGVAAAPKPMTPPPGAPMPPPGVPKPPAPGVPPGGLNATPPPKKDEGELIE